MRKHVWIMNHYAGSMYVDCGGRHYNFAKYLKRAGYEPVIFCANSKHGPAETWFPNDTLWHEHMAEEIGVPFVFVKVRTYTGNGKQRVLNMLDFYRNVKKAAKEYAVKHGKPDVIYASSVHPLTLVAGIQLAKRFGVKCVCEVRDLWPEAIACTYPNRFPRNGLIMRLFYQGEKWIYKKSDQLIFTWEGAATDYLINHKWVKGHGGPIDLKKSHYINNGVDLVAFDANREAYRTEDQDLDAPDSFKVVYTGSIRRVNELGLILDAAKEVRDPRVKFLLWGTGDEVPALRRRVEEEHIENVVFKGQLEKKYVPYILSRSDINLEHWQHSELLKYGTSHNKLFEYLAAGRPIFSTIKPAYSAIAANHCGAEVKGTSPQEIAEGIQALASLPREEMNQMGRNAREAAKEYDFQNLTKKLITVIES